MKNEELFLIYTDVVGSTPLDEGNEDPISWRETSFLEQLKMLLSIENSLALKSIGDALFITVKSDTTSVESRKLLCKKVLACTYKAYTKSKKAGIKSTLKKEIKIRAVVHLINEHYFGDRIANKIINAIKKGDIDDADMKKSGLLIKALQEDIFGTEVNKAARIQSLVKSDAILVSEEIARIIEDEDVKYIEKKIKLGYISFEYNKEKYRLHSSVPVIKLKGLALF
ncbi:hypothetical protein LCGC14_1630260 [marine sediment metagenome]|uniref:Guanylate cyclase domain-containing protein n=1 Tax=marine sediment metagenome TaxID=412755 RepID=A0A0F9I311_9ZZZZ